MNVLGVNGFTDSSATLLSAGEIVHAIEEERLNREKHYTGMPWLAVEECFDSTNTSLKDINIIALGWNPFIGWKSRIFETLKSVFRTPGAFKGKVSRGGGYVKGCKNIIRVKKSLLEKFSKETTDNKAKVAFVDHHLAHAASAFLVSPYDIANIIVADGVGESATVSFYSGEGTRIEPIARIHLPHSLGHLYAAVTGFLGFRMNHDEGKVMALAAFGNNRYRDLFDNLVEVDRTNKKVKLNAGLLDYHAARNGYFSREWLKLTGVSPRKRDEPLNERHMEIASSLQSTVENVILQLLKMYFPDRRKPLCAAGGLFLNSVLNGRILREYTERFFVQPAAGDNGTSLGAALYVSSEYDSNYERCPVNDVYFGKEYEDNEIERVLDSHVINVRKTDNVAEVVAGFIADGKIIGWFQGRTEFGPRALGNRSILASPTNETVKDKVNLKIKHREPFRPFAGSVILSEGQDYFEAYRESPFMLKVFRFKSPYENVFRAINHIDDTCRIQTVSEGQNPKFYGLLRAVKRKTGYGIVLNTSMNVAGEPIVNSPDEAIRLIKNSNIDVLVLNDFIIRKEDVLPYSIPLSHLR
jgi:carbamoyltransferase